MDQVYRGPDTSIAGSLTGIVLADPASDIRRNARVERPIRALDYIDIPHIRRLCHVLYFAEEMIRPRRRGRSP